MVVGSRNEGGQGKHSSCSRRGTAARGLLTRVPFNHTWQSSRRAGAQTGLGAHACWAAVLLVALCGSAHARHLSATAAGVLDQVHGIHGQPEGTGGHASSGAEDVRGSANSDGTSQNGSSIGAAGGPGSSQGEPQAFKYPVWWFAPFWSGSGYSSEASNYMLSMLRAGAVRESDLWIGHHGDVVRQDVKDAMHPQDRRDLEAMEGRVNRSRPAIVICHSLPSNWMYPSPMGWAGAKCPPDPREAPYVYAIGRTMFETDRLPPAFVARCNAMNEVWVPSTFSRDVFASSGVAASKLRVVPEGVNTTLFDPARHAPMPLPQGDLVFGTPSVPQDSQDQSSVSDDSLSSTSSPSGTSSTGGASSSTSPSGSSSSEAGSSSGGTTASGGSTGATSGMGGENNSNSVGSGGPGKTRPFRFLSTFKWEARKGWDVLLGAYLTAFSAQDNVELYIITKPFQGSTNFVAQMHRWAERQWGNGLGAAAAAARAQPPAPAQAQPAAASAGASSAGPSPEPSGQAPSPTPPPTPSPSAQAQSSQPVDHHVVMVQQLQESVRLGRDVTNTTPAAAAAAGAGSPSSAGPSPAAGGVPPFNASLLPRVYVVHHHIADADWARYYASVDAFVLPSRGEGWGRPHVEAMSMGLPVLSTNWSGITAYLDEQVGYPISVERLVPADPSVWWFRGLRWAQPSREHLTRLMRHVFTHRDEAAAKGAAARARMLEQFSPEPIGKLLAAELRRVDALIPQ